MLKNNGYNVKVINLLEMDKSDCYNPFSYIREETDVVKLITNLISNTTPKGATPSDPSGKSERIVLAVYLLLCVAGGTAGKEKL